MKDSVLNYLIARLPGTYSRTYAISLIMAAACVMYLSVVALHAFIPSPQPLLEVLLHALAISLTYTVSIAVAVIVLLVLKPDYIQVWQVWLVSVVIYALGFWLSQYADALTSDVKYNLHPDLNPEDGLFHFLRLIPIWLVMTFLLLGQLQRRALAIELAHVSEINSQLSNKSIKKSPREMVEISSGKKLISLEANTINCVSVDDHYCSIFIDEELATKRLDVSQPLTAMLDLLPEQFVRVHRSHIVNLTRVNSISREDRNLRLLVGDHNLEVPVSRSRASAVLRRLES